MCFHRPLRSGPLLAALAAGTLVASLPKESRAEQFILIDATFDYTWDDAMNAKPDKSHFYVNEGNFLNKSRPTNWLSPVDYRNGTLHVRAEVFKKPPGTQTTGWTLCYIANVGNYGCADTDYYTSTGVFERETKMTSFWQNETIQWDRGIKQVDLIYAINDSGSGHITNYPALKDLTTPTRVRITMVQVSAGSKYDPSIIGLGADAGQALDAGDASDAWPWDAGSTTGFAGSGGSAGAGGSVTSAGGMGGLLGTGGTGGPTGNGSGGAGGGTPIPSSTGPATGTTGGAAGTVTNTTNGNTPGASNTESGCSIANHRREPSRGSLAALCMLGLLGWTRRRKAAPSAA